MKWTTDKPTEPGWYWRREAGANDTMISEIVHIRVGENSLWVTNMEYAPTKIDEYIDDCCGDDLQWAGPIEEPTP